MNGVTPGTVRASVTPDAARSGAEWALNVQARAGLRPTLSGEAALPPGGNEL
jgi:hypothetical protein